MADEKSKATENFERYTYARDNGHKEFVEKAKQCENFFYGKHWDSGILAKLKAEGKPALTINKIFSTLITVQGEQLETAADISFKPAATGLDETATALTKLWINIANNNNLSYVEQEVFNSGAITSRGFFDVRIGFDDHLKGEVTIKRQKAKNVVIDSDADSYDPDDWNEVFLTKWFTPKDIEMLYGKDKATHLGERSSSQFNVGYDSVDHIMNTFGSQTKVGPNVDSDTRKNMRRFIRAIERQYKEVKVKDHFVDRLTGDTRVIPDQWDRAKITRAIEQYDLAVIPRKHESHKWMVTADDIVLFDSDSLYKHFTLVPYFPFFFEGQTIGLVENLLSPQELLNKSASQELHIINTTANSGWKIKAGSLLNMDIEDLEARGAETGVVLELDDVKSAEKITPNSIPTGLDRMVFQADENIKEISGVSDSKRGMDRADVAAKAIQAKQQAGSINLAVPLSNLIRTRHMVAKRVLDLVQEYYTEERIIAINKAGLKGENQKMTLNEVTPEGIITNDLTIGEYEIVVTDVPKRDTLEDQQFNEAVQLRELGVQIPDHVLISASHLINKAEIVEELKQMNGGGESSEAEQQLAQLEMQLKQLEAEEKQAQIMKTKADAALLLARAQAETLKDPNGKQDLDTAAQEMQMAVQEKQIELQLKKDDIEANIELKRDELAAKQELEREEFKENRLMRRAEMELKNRELALKEKQMEREAQIKETAAANDAAIKRQAAADSAAIAKTAAANKPAAKTGDK